MSLRAPRSPFLCVCMYVYMIHYMLSVYTYVYYYVGLFVLQVGTLKSCSFLRNIAMFGAKKWGP